MAQLATKATAVTKAAPLRKNTIHHMDVMDFLAAAGEADSFDLAIIDPPYNIGKNFGNSNDNMPLAAYIDWSIQYINECLRLMKPSALVYVYGYPEILAHVAVRYPMENQRWLAWHYTNKTVPASQFWQRSYESILCLWKGSKPKLQVDEIREGYTETFLKNAAGKVRYSKPCRFSKGNSQTIYQAHTNGALPRDVIKIPALAGGAGYSERVFYCNTCSQVVMGKEKNAHSDCDMVIHPTQKPAKLTEKLIKGSAPKTILIPFAGTGSECYVAKQMGIDFYAAELNANYACLANEWLGSLRPPTNAGQTDGKASWQN